MIEKEDVLQVVGDLNKELTDAEVMEVLNRYESEQEEDSNAEWYLIVEKIMYDLIDERN